MNNNVKIAAGMAIIILGLLVIITPRYLFPVCEFHSGDDASIVGTAMAATLTPEDGGMGGMGNGMGDEEMAGIGQGASMAGGHMQCYFTSRGALMLGLLIMAMGVAIMLARTTDAIRLLSLVTGAAGAAVVLLPTYFLPICENPQMPCHDGAEPLLIVLGTTILLVAAFLALFGGKDQPLQKED